MYNITVRYGVLYTLIGILIHRDISPRDMGFFLVMLVWYPVDI